MVEINKMCPGCDRNLPSKDFYNKEICYHCNYKEKTKHLEPVVKKCAVCESKLPSNRRVVCCDECAYIQANKQKKRHWTLNIRSQPLNFGGYF